MTQSVFAAACAQVHHNFSSISFIKTIFLRFSAACVYLRKQSRDNGHFFVFKIFLININWSSALFHVCYYYLFLSNAILKNVILAFCVTSQMTCSLNVGSRHWKMVSNEEISESTDMKQYLLAVIKGIKIIFQTKHNDFSPFLIIKPTRYVLVVEWLFEISKITCSYALHTADSHKMIKVQKKNMTTIKEKTLQLSYYWFVKLLKTSH